MQIGFLHGLMIFTPRPSPCFPVDYSSLPFRCNRSQRCSFSQRDAPGFGDGGGSHSRRCRTGCLVVSPGTQRGTGADKSLQAHGVGARPGSGESQPGAACGVPWKCTCCNRRSRSRSLGSAALVHPHAERLEDAASAVKLSDMSYIVTYLQLIGQSHRNVI